MTKARILAVALAFVGSSAVWANADDRDDRYDEHDNDVTLQQVPEKARAKIEKEVGDGHIKDIERKTHPTGEVYQVEYRTQKGDDYKFSVTKDGKVLDKRRDW